MTALLNEPCCCDFLPECIVQQKVRFLDFYFRVRLLIYYWFSSRSDGCDQARTRGGGGGDTPPPLDPKKRFLWGLGVLGGKTPLWIRRPFLFVLLLREVGDVRWIPLLRVWKIYQKILRKEKKCRSQRSPLEKILRAPLVVIYVYTSFYISILVLKASLQTPLANKEIKENLGYILVSYRFKPKGLEL